MTDTVDLGRAVAALTQGGVIAYPTEAVWGLGCDPRQQAAVMRLLEIKRRPV
ncbi:L-threonylcarbamoyladenylate synthase, partial [Xanthomonas citri]